MSKGKEERKKKSMKESYVEHGKHEKSPEPAMKHVDAKKKK